MVFIIKPEKAKPPLDQKDGRPKFVYCLHIALSSQGYFLEYSLLVRPSAFSPFSIGGTGRKAGHEITLHFSNLKKEPLELYE